MLELTKIWRSWWTVLIVGLLCYNNNTYHVSAEGNIGCLFAESLCIERVELCYDDFAFGKCLPQFGLTEEDLQREPLGEEQSGLLATMLEELQGAGLTWEHPFVQCRIQGALFALRSQTIIPRNLCASLAPDPEIIDPQSPLAFVRFTPPNDDFADEVYYPPPKKAFDDRLYIDTPKYIEPVENYNPADLQFLAELTKPDNRFHEPIIQQQQQYLNDDNHQMPINTELQNRMKDIKNRIELRRMLAEYESGNLKPPIYQNGKVFDASDEENLQRDFKRTSLGSHFKERQEILTENAMEELFDELNKDQLKINEDPPKTSFREIARAQHIPEVHVPEPMAEETNDELPEVFFNKNWIKNQLRNSRYPLANDDNENSNDDDDADDGDQLSDEDKIRLEELTNEVVPAEAGVYTEGGLVYLPDSGSHKDRSADKQQARDLLANMLGFTRHERLDVKKPGPPAAPPPSSQSPHEAPKINTPVVEVKSLNKEILPAHFRNQEGPKIKKEVGDHSDEDHAPHSVDTEYAHVIFKNPFDNWRDGARIVSALSEMLHLQSYFTHPRVDRHEVSFRVEPNPDKKSAADVAKAINDSRFKNNISRRLGVIVLRAGVGDKTKNESYEMVTSSKLEVTAEEEGPDVTHVMAYMFAGAGAAAVVVIVITLFLIKRHDRKRDKLGGLQAGLSGTDSSSKDYQELCRARMSGRGNNSDTTASGRIASLSKENDGRPPSSRSSTSSWSEEPALTNMDISTGHMVLSYMEDHLRNKGRLQREWEALCRYEAEPSAREAALQPQCTALNRSGSPLPFDHSRVVLNHLANAEGLDYINASTITDHDPRAPAYVAAQGPMQSTLAHFWQMIWEQGAVVIVALCRLQENGDTACARYWPEEGAEIYHIYEVHLVSEHIWCDDYLVRSFYLKNLQTGETRTVTQFHFLSWPQAGVPAQAKALLEFRRKVNKSYRGRSCPIVVHSSNGAGRTGAYILLDLVLARMNKGAREIDIAATLEHLRDQRAGLVETRQQFEFVLMAVAEEVHAILKALPANSQQQQQQQQQQQGEKRELDKEAVKEQEGENEKAVEAKEVKEKK